MKKMDSGEITCYLLTLQLVKAGYQITYDEVIEQVGIKQFLSVPKEDRNRYLQGKLSVDKLISPESIFFITKKVKVDYVFYPQYKPQVIIDSYVSHQTFP